ncbi:hypothetical protein [Achromobacter arsenitoxydans]|uniref:Uncharacterized protein n=1 Tax=Achromobacter arsenitoxydans SY8 TaxID=477184 RepID=H0F0F6_9BURK|nr:hypothetical protein [Achromobacter arsenitoxydans]EHK68232.1 hypothetical protein KYC_01295 [Achromobacter arsenitoxydans SY8]
MELLGVQWSLRTASEFWSVLAINLVVAVIIFGGHQILRKIQGKNWTRQLNPIVFTLLLTVSIVVGDWVDE